MAKRMLIDAAHPEETRVVVLSGNRLEEFDFESSTKKHVKGNIYLAKVTRVEPSLQAAFVDYGNHRHGFLAFSEIHPDYYKIPVADREIAERCDAARQPSCAANPASSRRVAMPGAAPGRRTEVFRDPHSIEETGLPQRFRPRAVAAVGRPGTTNGNAGR